MATKPKVTPAQQVGRVRVEVSLGPIARMFAAEEWQRPENAGGGAVFAGRVGEVRENVPREDREHAPADQFNFDAKIHDAETGHPVPYLDVRADIAQGGKPVFQDLPLVPVARPHRGTAGFHYGNNVRLAPTGRYDVTVRVAPSPLVGTDPAPAAFTVDFDATAG